MTVTEFLMIDKEKYDKNEPGFCVRPRICCKDGWNASIQAGPWHKADKVPVTEDNKLGIRSVEVGFVEGTVCDLISYAEDKDYPFSSTIYEYVPLFVIENVCKKHGGIVGVIEYIKNPDGTYNQFLKRFKEKE